MRSSRTLLIKHHINYSVKQSFPHSRQYLSSYSILQVKVNMSALFCLQKHFLFDSDDIESVCVRFLFILSSVHWDVKYVMLTRIGVLGTNLHIFIWSVTTRIFSIADPVLDVLPVLPFQTLGRFLTDSVNLIIFTSWFKIKNKNHPYFYIQERSPYRKKMLFRICQEMISFASDALTLNFLRFGSVCTECQNVPRTAAEPWRIFNFAGGESSKWHHRQQTMMYELCPGRWQIRLSVSKADVKSWFKNVRSPWALKVSSTGLLRELKSRFSRHEKDQDSSDLWKSSGHLLLALQPSNV